MNSNTKFFSSLYFYYSWLFHLWPLFTYTIISLCPVNLFVLPIYFFNTLSIASTVFSSLRSLYIWRLIYCPWTLYSIYNIVNTRWLKMRWLVVLGLSHVCILIISSLFSFLLLLMTFTKTRWELPLFPSF